MMRMYRCVTVCVAFLTTLSGIAHAATISWNPASTNGGSDGGGAWDAVSTTWWDGTNATNWSDANADTAVFGAASGTAGTVTNSATRTVGGIVFNAAGSGAYTISGGTLTLSNTPTITANTNATIGSVIAGSGTGLRKDGAGTLTLTGANTYSGGTSVGAGTLQIGNGSVNGTIGSGTYAISNAARLFLNQGTGPANPTWANMSGAGTLELSDAAASSYINYAQLGLPAGFTGTLKIGNRGRIYGTPANFGGTTNVVLGNGTQFLAYDGTGNGTAYTYSQTFSISGVGSESGQNNGVLRVSGMNATFSGVVTLTGNAGLYTQSGAANSTLKVSGPIGDGGAGFGLTINAYNNPVTLSGANTFTGGVTIAAGQLNINSSSALGSGILTISAGSMGNTSGGSVTLTNNNPQRWNADFTFAGTNDLNLGTGAVSMNAGRNVTVSTNTLTVGGVVSGSSGLTKLGAGTLQLLASNTYSGNAPSVSYATVDIQSGVLAVGVVALNNSASSLGGGAAAVAIRGGTLRYVGSGGTIERRIEIGTAGATIDASGTGALVWNNTGGQGGANASGVRTLTLTGTNTAANTMNIALSDVGGALSLVKNGTGNWVLGASDTYTGATTVNGGVLTIASGTAFNSPVTITNSGALVLNIASADVKLNQALIGPGPVTVAGAGLTARIAGDDGAYAGAFSLPQGTRGMMWSGTNAGSAAATWNLSGQFALIETGAGNTTTKLGALIGTNAATALGAYAGSGVKTLEIGALGSNTTFAGVIGDNPWGGGGTGIVALNKVGAGRLTLTGVDTYSGNTAVGSGTLALSGSGSIGNSPVIAVDTNGVFDVSAVSFTLGAAKTLQGFGTVTGQVSASAGARIVPGTGGAAGTLTINGHLTCVAGTTNQFNLGTSTNAGGGANSLLIVNGNLSPGSATIAIVQTAPLTNGTYQLIAYTGAKPSTFDASAVRVNVSPRRSLALDETVTGAVNLVVGGSDVGHLVWNSVSDTNWDNGVNANWYNNDTASSDVFQTYDHVVFDDTSAVITDVGIPAAVQPTTFTIDTSTNAFVFTGAGRITGVASLTKNGTAPVTFATSNDFTGTVTIHAGSLVLGNGGTVGSIGTNGVVDNASLVFNRSDSLTVGNAISGSGSLLQIGTGTTTVSGANSHTGGTVVSKGTLVLNNNTAGGPYNGGGIRLGDAGTGTNDVTLTMGAGINSADATVGGVVSARRLGTITVTSNGTGAATINVAAPVVSENFDLVLQRAVNFIGAHNQLVLSVNGPGAGPGADSLIVDCGGGDQYVTSDGTTNVFGGNVRVRNGNWRFQNRSYTANDAAHQNLMIPDTSSVTVESNAVWDIRWGAETIDGLNGDGVVTMSSDVATYLPGSAVLTVGGGNGSGSFAGRLQNSGAAFTFAKTGSGRQVLTGTNTYTGFTLIQNGILQIGAGGTSGTIGTGAISNSGVLVFNRSDAITNSQLMIGSGSLVQAGAGTLTMVGSNAVHSGGTFVSNGTLIVQNAMTVGSFAVATGGALIVRGMTGTGDVAVAAGGTLGGTGVVNGAILANGVVAPGEGIGTLTVNSNVTFGSTGVLSVELAATNICDVLAVTLDAMAAGTLKVTLTNGLVPAVGDAFTVMTAFTINGGFASNDLPSLDPGLAWSVTNTGSAIVLSVASNVAPPAFTGYDAFSNLFALAGGPMGDANNDGWKNLAAYALGFDPTGAAHSGLSGGIVSGKLSLTFDVLDSRSDITYWAETSDTLMTNDAGWTWIWTNKPVQTLAGPNAQVLTTSGETNTVRVSDTNAGTNRFLRLRITRP